MANEVTTSEAAKMLDVTPRHIRWYHARGLLVGRQIADPTGRVLQLVFRREDVESFVKPKKSGRPRKVPETESGGTREQEPGRPQKKAK